MNEKKLDELMSSLPSLGFPSAQIAVTVDGKKVYSRTVGYADAEKTRPASPDDLYWVFSCSKVVACTAAMRLVEEGKIALYDRVDKYIPSFAPENMSVMQRDGSLRPAEVPIRLIHLFTMTGGMDYNFNAPNVMEARRAPGADTVSVVSAMAKTPLLFDPGTRYRYSLCHDVLAAVVEVCSGMRFSEYVEKYIFGPLGMTSSGFHPTEEQRKRFCDMYRYHIWDGTSEPVPLRNEYELIPNYDSGGAGVFSNADDFVKLVTALACGGTSPDGYRLLDTETVKMMEKNLLCPAALADFVVTRLYGYGWGLCGRVHIDPAYSLSKSSAGEFGWDGAAAAFTMVDRPARTAFYFSTHVRSCNYAYNVLHPLMRNLVCGD